MNHVYSSSITVESLYEAALIKQHVGTKIGWKHGTTSNQLYRLEASLTGGEASPADRKCTWTGGRRARTMHVAHVMSSPHKP
jgi:hypothetical protein